jgi:hypothetical protein
MKFASMINRRLDGRWVIRHSDAEIGAVETTGDTRKVAIEKMRGELRYRLELCPCSGESYRHIEIEVQEVGT